MSNADGGGNPTDSLSAEEKLAILEYLRSSVSSWLGLFGFSSVGALILALVGGAYWVGFVLPGRAVQAAKDQLQAEIASTVGDLNKQVADQLLAAGENSERLRQLRLSVDAGVERIAQITGAEKETFEQAAELIALVDKSAARSLIEAIAEIRSAKIIPHDVVVIDSINSSDAPTQAKHPKTRSVSRDICLPSRVQFYSGRTTSCRLETDGNGQWTLASTRTDGGTVWCAATCFDLGFEGGRPTAVVK